MPLVCVYTPSRYDIRIQNNSFNDICSIIGRFISNKKVVVVTDKNVCELYQSSITAQLKNISCLHTYVLKAGEKSKNIHNVNLFYNYLLSKNIKRDDYLIALGGGVVGDFVGFCSSTYLRGVGLIHIPTTLLSQVDSCIGGKTAINLKKGKNSVGTFFSPKFVLCDPSLLDSLPHNIFCQGMAEVIKYAICFDKKLFHTILNEPIANNLEKIVYDCALIKSKIVQTDEKDFGVRKKLNFGHTIAHAIETHFNYKKISHGEAVSIGMATTAKLAYKAGIVELDTVLNLLRILKKFSLPTRCPISMQRLYRLSLSDKKRFEGGITLSISHKIGDCFLLNLSLKEYYKFLSCKLRF